MIGVDFGNDQRHGGNIRAPGVADHDVTGGGKCGLESLAASGVERREHNPRRASRRAGVYIHAEGGVGGGVDSLHFIASW